MPWRRVTSARLQPWHPPSSCRRTQPGPSIPSTRVARPRWAAMDGIDLCDPGCRARGFGQVSPGTRPALFLLARFRDQPHCARFPERRCGPAARCARGERQACAGRPADLIERDRAVSTTPRGHGSRRRARSRTAARWPAGRRRPCQPDPPRAASRSATRSPTASIPDCESQIRRSRPPHHGLSPLRRCSHQASHAAPGARPERRA